MVKTYILIAAISGFLAVAVGAFGAHGLKARLTEDMLAVYQTGVQYHFYHTFALLVAALLLQHSPLVAAYNWAAVLFLIGILVFSGSLYILAISGIRWLGAITPLGGLAFLGGWSALAIGAWQSHG